MLDHLNLSVASGEIVVITGVSGAGKTTLLTLCGALRSIQRGEIHIAGQSLNGLSPEQQRQLRASMGFIFQSHHLIDALTAGQNVVMSLLGRFPTEQAIAKAEAALAALGLAGRADSLPELLSGGEKQRVAVARALVRHPDLILADEPTASLDNASAESVIRAIQTAASQSSCAVLLVTHDPRAFPIAHRILRLEGGRLFESAAANSVYSPMSEPLAADA